MRLKVKKKHNLSAMMVMHGASMICEFSYQMQSAPRPGNIVKQTNHAL